MRRLAYAFLAAALLTFGQTVGTLAQTADDTTERANRKCDTLKRRIAKEETSLAAFEQTIAEDKKGRESCSTKPLCARYDEAIKTMEARKAQHKTRLDKFQADAAEACKPS